MYISGIRTPAGIGPALTRKVTPMATKTQDYSAIFKDMMGAFPVDTKAFEGGFKSSTALVEKMSNVAFDAAGKSTDLTAKWAQDTLAKLTAATKAKAEPADYAKAMTDFLTASAEAAAEHMAAFAEIAKKVQTETLELVMAAGKDVSEDMTTAAKKATADVTAAVKKTAAN